jgi:hypothetical protein
VWSAYDENHTNGDGGSVPERPQRIVWSGRRLVRMQVPEPRLACLPRRQIHAMLLISRRLTHGPI